MIPLQQADLTGREIDYIKDALTNHHLQGAGKYADLCQKRLQKDLQVKHALITHSCTAALEMGAILADVGPGDEVIMPSFTFTSTANAVAIRSGVPVFVDVRPDTLNIDETKIEAAITPKTKAIFVVHYAGVSCAMDPIMAIAKKHRLRVVEDAAQAIGSTYKNRKLGAIGDMGALSFHETKNVISGEGGAFLTSDEALSLRADILLQKGTNRKQFLLGLADKYTWVDIGSSYYPSDLICALLLSQLERTEAINAARLQRWGKYFSAFAPLAKSEIVQLPHIPTDCQHNAHLFWMLVQDQKTRDRLIVQLRERGIKSAFHYIPLHSSPAGIRFGRIGSGRDLPITDNISSRLIRLPLDSTLNTADQDHVICSVMELLK